MKVLLSLFLCFFSLNAFAQEKANEKDKVIPQHGTDAVPELQQDNIIENPFRIGPYKGENYQYTDPDRDPDAVEEPQEENPL